MADLNSTIVRGNLRVTEEIIGPLNVANLSTGANGQFLSVSNNIPTWVNNPDTNTWRPIKLDGTVKLNQWTSSSELNIKAGNNMTITESGGTFTFAATDTNTWRPLGTGADDAAAGNHAHDGRYLRWAGSAANADAMSWGTLTSANGYSILSHASSSDGGDWGMTYQGGKIYMQLDGYYYQNEGQYRVLDTSGGTIDAGRSKAPLILKGGVDNYNEGLRIVPANNNWTTIMLCGNDVAETEGTSANSWSIHNNNGKFYISKNGSDYATTKLSNTDGTWRVNDNDIIHKGNIGSQNVNYANSAGNADTLDGKHSSDFCLSNSNINNLPINGGIYWNSYVESSTDGSDAASITVIKDGNGSNGTVLQIKQANDANDIVNVVAGDLRLNGTSVSTYGHDHDDRYYTESEVNTKLNGKSDTGHTHSSVTDIGNSTATTFAYSKSGLNYGDYTWLAGWNGYELRAVNKSQFATAGHTHSNYVTTDTDQTISGKKTFSNIITANNWLYVPSIGTKTNQLYIEGPWDGAGQEQPTLTFEDGALKAYNWEYDGDSTYESMFYFNFPYGVQMNASGSSIYLNGNTGCTLESTAKGWRVAGNDTYGCIYPAATHNGKIGLSANHFYEGFINYIYANNIYPISTSGTTPGYNIGNVGSSSKYFSSGAFRTVYRSSESGLSDIRSKQNISNNDLNALEIINNLNIINFQYDDDIKIEAKNKKQRLKAINAMKELPKTKETKELRKELQKIIATPNNEDMITIGVSAQQLQELLPKKYQKTFIQKESTNQYADQLFIRENRLIYLSFKAIQEQQAIIGSLEEKINLLEGKINALEEKMKKEVN